MSTSQNPHKTFSVTVSHVMEPVGWQFFQDGQWYNGDDRIKDHRSNTEAAGMPVRDVFAMVDHAEAQKSLASDIPKLDLDLSDVLNKAQAIAEKSIEPWGDKNFRHGAYKHQVYGNTDWALARIIWTQAVVSTIEAVKSLGKVK